MTAAPETVSLPRAPRRRRLPRPGRLEPVLWIAPALAVVVFVFGYSMVELAKTSLRYEGTWTFENFHVTWSDPAFRTALTHNGRLLLAVPVLVASALLVSVLLFEGLLGWRFHRWAVFLPFVLPIPVIGVIFGQLLQFNGLANQLLRAFGLGGLAQDWLGQPRWALWTMTAVIIWKELGFGVILFLARLMSVPEELYEAARIDGAGWWKTLRYVTVPQLAPAIVFYAVVETITMLSWVFAYVYVMTAGGPGNATVVSEYYIFQQTFQNTVIGIGAAAAVTLLGFVAVLIVVRMWILRRFESVAFAG